MVEKNKINWQFLLEDKKKFILMVSALFLGICLMFVGNITGGSTDNINAEKNFIENTSEVENSLSAIAQAEKSLEERIQRILEKIDGVGNVAVTVFLEESPQYEYAINVSTIEKKIDEVDGTGGTRVTTEYTEDGNLVLLRSGTNGEDPIIVKEIKPEIQGVLVVASGAKDPLIKEKITKALKTLLNTSSTKISVLEGR